MTSEQLSRAIGLIRSGEREEARELLQRVVAQDPTIEKAWLWLVETLPDDTQRVAALEMCLKFNPDSQLARRGLNLIMQAHAGPNAPRFISEQQPAAEQKYEPTTYDREFETASENIDLPQEDYLARIQPALIREPDLEELTFRQVELPAIASSPPVRTRRRKDTNPLPAILAVVVLAGLTFLIATNFSKLTAFLRPTAIQQPVVTNPSALPVVNNPTKAAVTPLPVNTATPRPTPLPEPGVGGVPFSIDNITNMKVTGKASFTEKSIFGPFLSPERKTLAAINNLGVELFEIKSGKSSGVLQREVGNLTAFAFSTDGTRAATAYADRTVFLWDLVGTSAPAILRLDTTPQAIAYTADKKYLAVQIENKELQIFELSTRKLAYTIPNTMDINSSTLQFKILPDNRILTIERDRVTNETALRFYALPPVESSINIFGTSSAFSTIEISATGKYLAAGGNGQAIIYDTATGKELYNIPTRNRSGIAPFLQFFPSENYIIIDSPDEAQGEYSWPNVYRLDTGEWKAKIDGNITGLNSIAISPDEQFVALEGNDATSGAHTVELYAAETGQQLVSIPLDSAPGLLSFSPDNTLLISFNAEGASYLQTTQPLQ